MEYYFSIRLTYQEFLPFYEGRVKSIVVTTYSGIKVEFPAQHIRQYLTSAGITGEFCLKTQNNKFFSIEKISI